LIGVIACGLSGIAFLARATPLDHFGLSVGQQSTAGGTVASPSGVVDVLSNPALISLNQPHLTIGLTTVFDRTAILLMPRPAGYEPAFYDVRLNPRGDTFGRRANVFTVGAQFVLLPRRVFGGVIAVLPSEGVARISSSFGDESEQYFNNQLSFARFGRRLSSEVFGGGLSYRFSDRLSFGVAALVVPQVVSRNDVYTPNAAKPSSALVNLDTRSATALGIVAGFQYRPIRGLRIGLSFRDEITAKVAGQNVIQISGAELEPPFEQGFEIVQDSMPLKVSTGIRWAWPTGSFIDAGASLVGWSNLTDEHGELMGMSDVVEANIGGGISFDDANNEVRFGFGWRPSPTPSQTGRTNYVDNDRVVVAGGSRHRFKMGRKSVRVGLSVQVQSLLSEQTRKVSTGGLEPCKPGVVSLCDEVPNQVGLQTGNPGFPGFAHGGHLMTVGLDAQWYYDE
jgi:long-chain fatty acid transport protein